tara:strand:- start:733 stop:1077 length:345 start_codon:yes stop_codon:yes gene_type:complete
MNKITMLGRLTRDIENRSYGSDGGIVGKFGLAVNTYRGKDKEDDVCFIDVACFGRVAETIGKYFSKGDAILVEGKLKLNTWEKDGQKRSKHEIVLDTFHFLPAGKERVTNSDQF